MKAVKEGQKPECSCWIPWILAKITNKSTFETGRPDEQIFGSILENEEWVTPGRTFLIQKDKKKGNEP